MPKLKLLLLTLAIIATTGITAQVTTTRIFIVRHADRETFDDLNAAGINRASELKRMLLHTGIDSIFSTKFIRTKKTVAPLAEAIGVPIMQYDSNPQVLKRIFQFNKGNTVLVSGHSNTVPQLIKLCGCKPPFDNIPDTQFDNLFLVIIQQIVANKKETTTCRLLPMKYGAVTN